MSDYARRHAELCRQIRQQALRYNRIHPELLDALHRLKDELEQTGDPAAAQVLVEVYVTLQMQQSAYRLLSRIIDKRDKKQLKLLGTLYGSLSEGDSRALARPDAAQLQAAAEPPPVFAYDDGRPTPPTADGLQPFPLPDSVFAPDQPWLAQHLLPLLSLDLGTLKPEWTGSRVCLFNPIEPFNGLLGEHTAAAHGAYTAPNWLAFRLDGHNRHHFLAGESYFERADPAAAALYARDAAATFTAYQGAREHYRRQGTLPHNAPFVDSLGGAIDDGNWTEHALAGGFPAAFDFAAEPSGDRVGVRISHQGRPFFQIAATTGHYWCPHSADAILLFYEPHSRTLLQTFDWS